LLTLRIFRVLFAREESTEEYPDRCFYVKIGSGMRSGLIGNKIESLGLMNLEAVRKAFELMGEPSQFLTLLESQ
jgi:hypothetical protein